MIKLPFEQRSIEMTSYKLNIVFALFLFLNVHEIRSQQNDRVHYSLRTTFSVLQGFGNYGRDIFYNTQYEPTGYGLRVVNGIKYRNSDVGLGIGIEQWDSKVFTLFMSYLYGFGASRYMPWLFIKIDGGWAHGEMNPDSPYPYLRSENAWFWAVGPGARIWRNNKISVITGIQYEFHKQILKKEYQYWNNNARGLNYIGLYLGLGYLKR